MRFLICGLGSIGRRHLRNLVSLGEDDIILLRTGKSTPADPRDRACRAIQAAGDVRRPKDLQAPLRKATPSDQGLRRGYRSSRLDPIDRCPPGDTRSLGDDHYS